MTGVGAVGPISARAPDGRLEIAVCAAGDNSIPALTRDRATSGVWQEFWRSEARMTLSVGDTFVGGTRMREQIGEYRRPDAGPGSEIDVSFSENDGLRHRARGYGTVMSDPDVRAESRCMVSNTPSRKATT